MQVVGITPRRPPASAEHLVEVFDLLRSRHERRHGAKPVASVLRVGEVHEHEHLTVLVEGRKHIALDLH